MADKVHLLLFLSFLILLSGIGLTSSKRCKSKSTKRTNTLHCFNCSNLEGDNACPKYENITYWKNLPQKFVQKRGLSSYIPVMRLVACVVGFDANGVVWYQVKK